MNASPRVSFEELEIRTQDGVSLRALVEEPPEGSFRGTLILAHAMFARKSSFGTAARPGLAHVLAARGFRTIAFDFRGHGDSTREGDFGFDDFVRRDLPTVCECARARSDDKPVVVLGHSLGGNVALAAQGTGRLGADALVVLGANVWLRALEPSRARWALKAAVGRAALAVSARASGLPARRWRWGTDDASEPYVTDLFRGVTHDCWTSADGRDDYLAALAGVTVPVAAVLGERDRLLCHPEAGAAFVRRCAGLVGIHHTPGDHRGLIAETARPAVVAAVEWAVQARP